MVSYFLVKSEPGEYSWDDLVRDGHTVWSGVRSFEARHHLRQMSVGDRVLFYHSGAERAVVGVASVRRAAYADPTAPAGEWSAVDLEPIQPLVRPVTLARIKSDPAFARLALVQRSRLSVLPVLPGHFQRILELGETVLASELPWKPSPTARRHPQQSGV
jgi:predicted RNA-binding protein with PUA-like domain